MHRIMRRPIIGLILLVLGSMLIPVAAQAQSSPNPTWYGWGVHIDFANNKPVIHYIAYSGRGGTNPQIIDMNQWDISSHCMIRSRFGGAGILTYPTTDSAFFDGNTYIRCELPTTNAPVRSGTVGMGPFWVDANIKGMPTTLGTYPLFDISERGVRMNLERLAGNTARTQIQVASNLAAQTYTTLNSPGWSLNSAGNRTVLGWNGRLIEMVASSTGWLGYLQDPAWQSYFQGSGPGLISWNESPTTSSVSAVVASNYELGNTGGILYIGYSPSTGTYFVGEIDEAGIEPGSKAN
ncbi:MAG: hypothetical protein Fur005_48550 [Roseiflexaceae bacterium]